MLTVAFSYRQNKKILTNVHLEHITVTTLRLELITVTTVHLDPPIFHDIYIFDAGETITVINFEILSTLIQREAYKVLLPFIFSRIMTVQTSNVTSTHKGIIHAYSYV